MKAGELAKFMEWWPDLKLVIIERNFGDADTELSEPIITKIPSDFTELGEVENIFLRQGKAVEFSYHDIQENKEKVINEYNDFLNAVHSSCTAQGVFLIATVEVETPEPWKCRQCGLKNENANICNRCKFKNPPKVPERKIKH
jgi:hypothetical protein